MFKKIEFKESGYPIIEVSFWLIILLSIVSIIIIFFSDIYNFSVKSLNYPLEIIKINMEYGKKISPHNVLFCFEDYCSSLESDLFNNVSHVEFSNESEGFFKTKVKNIYLAYPKEYKNFEDNIRNTDIHVGNKNYYYKNDDIKKFDRKTTSIKLENSDKENEYSVIILPEVNNYKGILSHIKILFLSLFYNWQIFSIQYFWLFCSFLIYIFNKDKFKFKPKIELNSCIILSLIIFLGFLLRIVDLTYYPLWTDEIYTKAVALDSFKSCFQDPGNPPLFFIIDFIFYKIFSNSNFVLRFPSFVFGVLFIFITFKVFENFSKKEALFVAFFASINLINIYHSQEARGYALSMLLIALGVYFLFKYLKKPTDKNLLIYGIIEALCINNNYYLILFSFSNFIWGVVDLIQNNNKKEIIKFSAVNVVSCLTFIPYFVISSKAALSQDFNAWIGALNKETLLYTINAYFINKYIFLFVCIIAFIILVLCFIPNKTKEKINIEIKPEKENLFIYLIYSIALILILSCAISIFIKPIFHKRTLLSIYTLLFMLEGLMIVGIVEFKKVNNVLKSLKIFYSMVLCFIYFSITSPMPLREIFNIADFINFVKNDSKLCSDNYEIHALTSDTKEYLKAYPEIYEKKNIHWHFLNTNNGSYLRTIGKNDYIEKDKKAILYFNSIGIDMANVILLKKNAYVYKSNLTPSAKLVFD